MTVLYVVGGAIIGSIVTLGILWYNAIRYYERHF